MVIDRTQITIERGTHGLIYLTDPADAAIFLAAPDVERAEALIDIARRALATGDQTLPMHVIHDHIAGARITVPSPEWMTPEQRNETIQRLQTHIRMRLLS